MSVRVCVCVNIPRLHTIIYLCYKLQVKDPLDPKPRGASPMFQRVFLPGRAGCPRHKRHLSMSLLRRNADDIIVSLIFRVSHSADLKAGYLSHLTKQLTYLSTLR